MITYKTTEDDYIEAQLLHYRALHLFFLIVGLVGLVAGIIAYFFFDQRWGAELIGAAVFWLLYHRYSVAAGLPNKVRKMYAQQPNAGATGELSWDSEFLEERHPNGDTKRKWNDYVRFTENDDLMMLYLSKEVFELFPKRFFKDPELLEDFRRNAKKAGSAA